MAEDLVQHYDSVAANYQKTWFYEDGTDYQQWLVRQLETRLQPDPSSRIVDLGAGTGNFSAAFHRLCGLTHKLLCVDPYESLLAQARAHPEVETLLMDGLGYVQRPDEAYDRLLLKEVVHHFKEKDLSTLFAGAFRQLRPAGRLVIMTRPHHSSHYPFFAGAHAAWSAAQLPERVYESALTRSGFLVSVDHADYPVTMPAKRWLSMLRGRFWSNLNGFSDAEMEAGLKEVRSKLVGPDETEEKSITFPDRIVFIVGVKPEGGAA